MNEIKGKHQFDPVNCSRCKEMNEDEVWQRARKLMNQPDLTPAVTLEHSEKEWM